MNAVAVRLTGIPARPDVDAMLDALADMTGDDLQAMARHGETGAVRVAAALVLFGRETAVPPHPPCPTTRGHAHA